MQEWGFAQIDPSDELAELHFFSVKNSNGRRVEFTITVREFVTPAEPTMRFFASADKLTNQKTAPYTPTGWGKTLLEALAECMRSLNRFPYEGEDAASA